MAGIDGDGEVGSRALPVGVVDGLVEALGEVGADFGDEESAGGKAKDADFVRIDVPLGGVLADEAHGALRVVEGLARDHEVVRAAVAVPVVGFTGDAIFQEDARDAGGGEPVADFGAFEIDGEDFEAAAGKHDDGGAGVVRGGRIDGECGFGDVADGGDGFACDEVRADDGCFGAGHGFEIGRGAGPEWDLGVAGGGLPGGGVGVRSDTRHERANGREPALHCVCPFGVE